MSAKANFHKQLITVGACLVLLISIVAEAQILEEVVVTAQKREQSLQDVGLSVTAFSGDQISALGYTNAIDIAQQTPALLIIQNHPLLDQCQHSRRFSK